MLTCLLVDGKPRSGILQAMDRRERASKNTSLTLKVLTPAKGRDLLNR